MPYEQRAQLVAACRHVDRVLPENSWDQKRQDILRDGIDIFAMGDDWLGKFDELADICQVVYLPRTRDISTTQLRTVIAEMRRDTEQRPTKPGPATPAAAEPGAAAPAIDADMFAEILQTAQQGRLDTGAYRRFHKRLIKTEDPRNTDWLRCWILLHCLMRKKPVRTQALISRFNRISRRRGMVQDYTDFMALLFQELALPRPIGSGYGHGFDTADLSGVIRGCREVGEKLAAQGLTVFANSGTLLGLVREGTLLGHDNDIDLAVLLKAQTTEAAAREWLALTGRLVEAGLATGRSEWSGVTLKLQKIGGFGVDLFPAWIDAEDRLFLYPHTAGTLLRSQLLPLGQDALTGLGLPSDPTAMLASNYGKDWRIPDEGWSFDWPRARREFAAFLALMPGASAPKTEVQE